MLLVLKYFRFIRVRWLFAKILVPMKRVIDPDNVNKVKISEDGAKVSSEGLEITHPGEKRSRLQAAGRPPGFFPLA